MTFDLDSLVIKTSFVPSKVSVTETEIWNRVIRPEQGNLSPEGARELLRLSLPHADIRRASKLGEKANEGTLTEFEAAELDEYLKVARALELIKAKARLSLKAAA